MTKTQPARLPHDVDELLLAPVVLAVDARIAHLASLSDAALLREVEAVAELPTLDARQRALALVLAVGRLVDLHGWTLSWNTRGIQLAHGGYRLVIGVSPSMRRYVSWSETAATAIPRVDDDHSAR